MHYLTALSELSLSTLRGGKYTKGSGCDLNWISRRWTGRTEQTHENVPLRKAAPQVLTRQLPHTKIYRHVRWTDTETTRGYLATPGWGLWTGHSERPEGHNITHHQHRRLKTRPVSVTIIKNVQFPAHLWGRCPLSFSVLRFILIDTKYFNNALTASEDCRMGGVMGRYTDTVSSALLWKVPRLKKNVKYTFRMCTLYKRVAL